jgi:pectate lyase
LLFYAAATAPYVLLVEDTILLNTYERVPVRSNKTLLGSGTGATLLNGGIEIKGNNVIVRNLRITGSYDGDWDGKTHSTDAITVYGKNVWIDHCDLSASSDGLLDIRADGNSPADFVTISWTRLSNHNKAMLFGAGDDEIVLRGHLRVTLHHCWFDGQPERGIHQRMPRVRFGDVHLFNNFFDDIGSYAIAARFESDLVVENNYFRNSKHPHNIEDKGLGLEDPDLVAIGNIYDNCSGSRVSGGVAFRPSDFYSYLAEDPLLLPARIMNGAGLLDDPANLGPFAVQDELVLPAASNTNHTLDVLANDNDPDGGELRVSAILRAPRGNARILDNAIRYTTPFDIRQPDTLEYQLVDLQGGLDTAVVAIHFGTVATRQQLSEDYGLSVYPNPGSDEIFVAYRHPGAFFTDKVQIEIIDLWGRRQVASTVITEGHPGSGRTVFRLDTGNVDAGSYFVRITDGIYWISQPLTLVK